MDKFTEKDAKETLEKGYKKAEILLNDENKMEEFLKRLKSKLEITKFEDNSLKMIPTLIEILQSYAKKEYKNIEEKSIKILISTLLYWLAPVDVIPDTVPEIGYDDDILIMDMCLNQISEDIKKYKEQSI